MNIWTKMITALRGGVNELGETVVDSQALRILDQEIRDADEELKTSKEALAEVMAKQKVAEQKSAELTTKIIEHEGYAVKALAASNEMLALEVAEKISEFEAALSTEQALVSSFGKSADELKQAVKLAERNLKYLKQQVDSVKATESVQKAQAAVAERHSGSQSKMHTAMESLERIKEKQTHKGAQMEAAREIAQQDDTGTLAKRLQEAGIAPAPHSAADVLARLRQKVGHL